MTAEAVRLHVGEAATARSRLAYRLAGRLNLGLYAKITRYGLCRDLALPVEKPNAKIPILMRPLENRDLSSLFCNDIAKHDLAEIRQREALLDGGVQQVVEEGRHADERDLLRPPLRRGLRQVRRRLDGAEPEAALSVL